MRFGDSVSLRPPPTVEALPGSEAGEAHTWGRDERVTYPICVNCAIQVRADLTSAITTPGMAVGSSSTPSQRSPRFECNLVISRERYAFACGVHRAVRRRIGRVISNPTAPGAVTAVGETGPRSPLSTVHARSGEAERGEVSQGRHSAIHSVFRLQIASGSRPGALILRSL